MAALTVRFVWRPRHTPPKTPKCAAKCFEYEGALCYDACVQFRLKLETSDRDAAYRAEGDRSGQEKHILWVKQHIEILGVYYDRDHSPCWMNPTVTDEYFSVSSMGASPQDFHNNWSKLYGSPCDLPCRSFVVVTAAVDVVRTTPLDVGARRYLENPDGTLPQAYSAETRVRTGGVLAPSNDIYMGNYVVNPVDCRILQAATDVTGTREAQARYPHLSYGYLAEIDHCGDISSAVPTPLRDPVTTGYDVNTGLQRPPLPAGSLNYHGPSGVTPPHPPGAEVPGSDFQRGGGGGTRPRPIETVSLIVPGPFVPGSPRFETSPLIRPQQTRSSWLRPSDGLRRTALLSSVVRPIRSTETPQDD